MFVDARPYIVISYALGVTEASDARVTEATVESLFESKNVRNRVMGARDSQALSKIRTLNRENIGTEFSMYRSLI